MIRLALVLATLVLWVVPVQAVDLSKIDRTIAKEPVYNSKPKYCLLVFGPEAKARFWLVLDGETLYVDRNANGDLTEAGEAAQARREDGALRFEIPDVTESDGKTKHTCLHLLQPEKGHVYLRVRIENGRTWWAGFDGEEQLYFAARPGDAPIVHFNGPRTFALLRPTTLERGPQTGVIRSNRLSIGTPGLGKGTFAALDANQIPRPMHLKAAIEFPNQKEGGEPIRVKEEFKFTS